MEIRSVQLESVHGPAEFFVGSTITEADWRSIELMEHLRDKSKSESMM